jgi:predicted  nucleic acid-binding Zn-ribbon protein
MGPVLNGLIKLQSVENLLQTAKSKLARCRRSVIIHENQVRSLQNALEAKKEEIQLTRIQCDRLELELKTRDAEIAKLRAALNASKTNKEYSALLSQLNTTKADNSKLEVQILELMKGIEADEAECENIRRQMEEQKQQLEKIRVESEQQAQRFQAEIEETQAQWNQIAKTIPSDPLNIFKRVAETYDGLAVAVIEQQEGKNATYSCGGCFMNIAAEFVNLLMTKDDIIRCPNCTRILVLGKFRIEE